MEEIIQKIKETWKEKDNCKHLRYPAKTPAPYHCISAIESMLRADLGMKQKKYD